MTGLQPGRYARVERERRFLLPAPPAAAPVRARRITDRYLTGTRLRLRELVDAADGQATYKLTQKVPGGPSGPVQGVQGLITNLYLDRAEYELLAGLPARVLAKTRYSVPPLGVDVFDPPLHGLVIAEAEFTGDAEMEAFQPPAGAIAEVTGDPRFTGGSLARTGRGQLLGWLGDYGLGRTWQLSVREG